MVGIVQGVGFRPFIHRLVTEYGLNGWIRNESYGVELELEGEGPFPMEALLDKPFFLTEREANYRRVFDRYLASREMVVTPFLEVSDTAFIIKLLEETRALSFLPRFAVEESVRQGKLRELTVADFHASMYRQIFYHKDKWKTREMDEFVRLAGGSVSP